MRKGRLGRIAGHLAPGAAAESTLYGGDAGEEPVISAEMRAHWEEHGWVLVPDAVPKENLEAVIADIFEFIGGSPDDPESWYATTEQQGSPVPAYGQGSMVQMFQTQALWDNRQSPRVYRAFAELYGREEMSVSIDRANLKPPQRPQSPGWGKASAVHWDMPPEQLGSPKMPDTMRIQGVLYLADTPANGGGFQCVSGFHHRFEEWVETVAPEDRGKNFEQQPTLKHLEAEPIAGKAGDLVIWNSFLPHGNAANTSDVPRLAQFITMIPADSTGNEGLDMPGIWRNGGLTFADHEEERQDRVHRWKHRIAGLSGPAVEGMASGEALNVYERSRPTAPAKLTELGEKLLGVRPWH